MREKIDNSIKKNQITNNFNTTSQLKGSWSLEKTKRWENHLSDIRTDIKKKDSDKKI
jgi:hypothetical protein